MLRRLRKLRRFLALPVREQLLTIEAAGWLAVANAAVRTLPLRWIVPRLGSEQGVERIQPHHQTALSRAIRNSPWSGTCLVQAIAGKLFLRRQGMRSALHIGVAKGASASGITAHAWLRVGTVPVVGGAASGYQHLCSYS